MMKFVHPGQQVGEAVVIHGEIESEVFGEGPAAGGLKRIVLFRFQIRIAAVTGSPRPGGIIQLDEVGRAESLGIGDAEVGVGAEAVGDPHAWGDFAAGGRVIVQARAHH